MVVDAVLPIRERHPQVPWRRISGLRDVLAHAYFGLEEDSIWQIVSESIPALAQQLDQVVEAEPGCLMAIRTFTEPLIGRRWRERWA